MTTTEAIEPPRAPAPAALRGVVGVLTASRALGAALQAAAYVVAAHRLAPAGFGTLLAGLALASAALVLVDLGISPATMRDLGAGRTSAAALRSTVRLQIACSTGGAALWAAVAAVVAPDLVPVALFLLAESLLSFGVLVAIACGAERRAAAALVAARATTLLVVAPLSSSLAALPVALAVGSAAGLLVLAGAPRIWRGDSLGAGPARRWRTMVHDARHLMGGAALVQACNLDTVLVAWVAGASAATFYGLPSRMTSPLGIAAQALAQVLLPRAAAAGRVGDLVALRRLQDIVRRFAGASAAVLALGAVGAGALLPRLVGGEYAAAVTPLRVILVAVALAAANAPLAAILNGLGDERAVVRTLALAIPAGLVLVAVFAAIGGAPAAGLGLVAMQLAILVRLWGRLDARLRQDGGSST